MNCQDIWKNIHLGNFFESIVKIFRYNTHLTPKSDIYSFEVNYTSIPKPGREIAPNTGANATKFFHFGDQILKVSRQIGN